MVSFSLGTYHAGRRTDFQVLYDLDVPVKNAELVVMEPGLIVECSPPCRKLGNSTQKTISQIAVGPASLFQPLDLMLPSMLFQMLSTTSLSLNRLLSTWLPKLAAATGSRHLSSP